MYCAQALPECSHFPTLLHLVLPESRLFCLYLFEYPVTYLYIQLVSANKIFPSVLSFPNTECQLSPSYATGIIRNFVGEELKKNLPNLIKTSAIKIKCFSYRVI